MGENKLEQLHILLVDDNAMNRRMLLHLLPSDKYQVTEADSGETCLSLVTKCHYDLIFMDYLMPGMDGIETIRRMNAMEDVVSKNVPVILVTASLEDEALADYRKYGFADYLAKPVSVGDLSKVLSKYGNEGVDVDSTECQMMPQIEGVDWDYSREHFANDEQLLDGLTFFYTMINPDLDELMGYYSGIENQDTLKLFQVKVHSMKNSAASIGIRELEEKAKALEMAAKNGEISYIQDAFSEYVSLMRCYQNRLTVVVNQSADKRRAVDHLEEIYAAIDGIHVAAAEMDIDELDRQLQFLESFIYVGELKDKVEKIGIAIRKFDLGYLRKC